MDFLTWYVNFDKRKMMSIFEKEVEQLTGRTTTMGVKEILLERSKRQGLEQGIERGRERERAKALEEKKESPATLKILTYQFPISQRVLGSLSKK